MKPLPSDDIRILRQLQAVGYQSAIIGGGAVRDVYLDRFPQDVDIFIWNAFESPETVDAEYRTINEKTLIKLFDLNINKAEQSELDFAYDPFNTQLHHVFNDMFGHVDGYDSVERASSEAYVGRGNHIVSVWDMYIDELEMSYQIIVLNKDPIEYVTKYFDIGLCMCYCDGVKMRYTDEFLTDAVNKTLTICGALTKAEYQYTLDHHIAKLKRYFPDYSVVDKLKGTFPPDQ